LLTTDLSKMKRIHQSNPRVRGKRGGEEEEEVPHHRQENCCHRRHRLSVRSVMGREPELL
jgi:hypothetical protein